MDMENSWKVGAVNGCPKKFSANTCEAVEINTRVTSTAVQMRKQLQDHLLGGGVGGECDMAG